MGGNRCEHIRVGTIVTKLWGARLDISQMQIVSPFPTSHTVDCSSLSQYAPSDFLCPSWSEAARKGAARTTNAHQFMSAEVILATACGSMPISLLLRTWSSTRNLANAQPQIRAAGARPRRPPDHLDRWQQHA